MGDEVCLSLSLSLSLSLCLFFSLSFSLERGKANRMNIRNPSSVDSSRFRLLTAGVDTGGRLAPETIELLTAAAAARTRQEPAFLRSEFARTWRR